MSTDPCSRRVFSRISGHPALDLVNTVEWRLSADRREDDLLDYDDVVRWSRQLELIDGTEAATLAKEASGAAAGAADEAAAVRALREAIYAALFEGATVDPVLVAYRDAVAAGELTRGAEGWSWSFPVELDLPRRRIALAAFDLLTATDTSPLAQCQDAECGWVFLDTSPRHNRRWCVSADCGNRNRQRDFAERARASRSATTSK